MKDLVHCEGQKRNRRMRNRDIEIEQKALLKTERERECVLQNSYVKPDVNLSRILIGVTYRYRSQLYAHVIVFVEEHADFLHC